MSGSRGSREPRGGSYQLGDLDLPAAPQRPAPPQPAAPGCPPAKAPANAQGHAPTPPASSAGARLGRATSVELDDQDSGDLTLELDMGPPGRANALASGLDFGFSERDLDGAFEGAAASELALDMQVAAVPRGVGARTTEAAPPTSEAAPGPVTSLVHVADEEQAARELADFGDAPTSFVGAIPYAFRVARRLLALRGERKQVAETLADREADVHAGWVGMGQALMNLAEDKRLEPLRSAMVVVQQAHAHVSRAGQTMAQTRAKNQEMLSALEHEAAQLQRELAPYREAVQATEQAHKKAEENLRRGQARQRRVELELRALAEATKVDPNRTVELNAQLEERQDQVIALSGALAQAGEALGQARRELALRSGGLAGLEDRKKRLLAQIRTAEAAVEEQAKAAEGSHAAALRALAEAARTQRLAGLVPAQAAQVAEAETAMAEAQKQLARHDQAMQLYDRGAVRTGVILVVVLIAAWVVALKLN